MLLLSFVHRHDKDHLVTLGQGWLGVVGAHVTFPTNPHPEGVVAVVVGGGGGYAGAGLPGLPGFYKIK